MFTVSLPPPMIDNGEEEDVFRTLIVLAPPPAKMETVWISPKGNEKVSPFSVTTTPSSAFRSTVMLSAKLEPNWSPVTTRLALVTLTLWLLPS